MVLMAVCAVSARAQSDSINLSAFSQRSHLVGFDANTLLRQVIPFNNVQTRNLAPAIVSRRLWGERGYRFATSFNMIDNNDNLTLYLSLGYTRKQPIGHHFNYIKGIDVRLAASDVDEQGYFAIAPYWGLEYDINDVISVSTETALVAGYFFEFGFPGIDISPPLHIQCHFNINNKKR